MIFKKQQKPTKKELSFDVLPALLEAEAILEKAERQFCSGSFAIFQFINNAKHHVSKQIGNNLRGQN